MAQTYPIVLRAPDGSTMRLERFPVVLGRVVPGAASQPDCDLTPFDTEGRVSREHAVIDWRDGRLYVTDLGSTNGTRLNGQPLPPNQRVEIGPTGLLTLAALPIMVEVEGTTAAPPVIAPPPRDTGPPPPAMMAPPPGMIAPPSAPAEPAAEGAEPAAEEMAPGAEEPLAGAAEAAEAPPSGEAAPDVEAPPAAEEAPAGQTPPATESEPAAAEGEAAGEAPGATEAPVATEAEPATAPGGEVTGGTPPVSDGSAQIPFPVSAAPATATVSAAAVAPVPTPPRPGPPPGDRVNTLLYALGDPNALEVQAEAGRAPLVRTVHGWSPIGQGPLTPAEWNRFWAGFCERSGVAPAASGHVARLLDDALTAEAVLPPLSPAPTFASRRLPPRRRLDELAGAQAAAGVRATLAAQRGIAVLGDPRESVTAVLEAVVDAIPPGGRVALVELRPQVRHAAASVLRLRSAQGQGAAAVDLAMTLSPDWVVVDDAQPEAAATAAWRLGAGGPVPIIAGRAPNPLAWRDRAMAAIGYLAGDRAAGAPVWAASFALTLTVTVGPGGGLSVTASQ